MNQVTKQSSQFNHYKTVVPSLLHEEEGPNDY
jgi:hypothetical protein